MTEIYGLLAIWSILGYFIIPTVKEPETKVDAFYLLFVGGPAGWVLFVILSVNMLLKK